MNTGYCKLVWAIGLMGVSAAAFAGDLRPAPPQEPVGFLSGAVIGAFAAGPIGAVVGAGLGTWLGNRVHRASEASAAEARTKALESDKSELQAKESTLQREKSQLVETNQSLTAKLDDLSQRIESARTVKGDAAQVLDGFEGDILFRTGSSEITPDIAHQIHLNMQLSQDRANAVRDLLLAAGISDEALEVNAYGKSQSIAVDSDGYALERRVRLTLQAQGAAPVAQVGRNE
jgi:outer membrane protein OmpA-like peptidoglycan-associated protein